MTTHKFSSHLYQSLLRPPLSTCSIHILYLSPSLQHFSVCYMQINFALNFTQNTSQPLNETALYLKHAPILYVAVLYINFNSYNTCSLFHLPPIACLLTLQTYLHTALSSTLILNTSILSGGYIHVYFVSKILLSESAYKIAYLDLVL